MVLAKGLRERGHHVAVGVFYAEGPFQTDLQDAGVPVHVLYKSGRWDIGRFMARLIEIVRAENPDILHSYLTTPNIFSVLIKPLFPQTRFVGGIRASSMDRTQYDYMAGFTDSVAWHLGRFSDLIVANSIRGGMYARQRGVSAGSLLVIANGIDTRAFRRDDSAGRRIRAHWGVNGSDRLIGVIGRSDPAKGLRVFLHAASLLHRAMPETMFVVVGKGSMLNTEAMTVLAGRFGIESRIVWAGEHRDLLPVYSALDVLCSPSIFGEGFSNVIGEAMACGVPCAVTDVGDSAEIVGELGTVCPPGDPICLKESIRILLGRKCGEPTLPDSCRARIEQLYTVDRMVRSTESAYRKLLNESPRCAGSRA